MIDCFFSQRFEKQEVNSPRKTIELEPEDSHLSLQ